LQSLIDSGRTELWPRKAIYSLIQMLMDRIANLHAQGVVHRDIKPGNILIEFAVNGDIKNVRLIDFGLACSTATQACVVVDDATSTAFASPELLKHLFDRARGSEKRFTINDWKSNDWWSLGITMLNVILGKPWPLGVFKYDILIDAKQVEAIKKNSPSWLIIWLHKFYTERMRRHPEKAANLITGIHDFFESKIRTPVSDLGSAAIQQNFMSIGGKNEWAKLFLIAGLLVYDPVTRRNLLFQRTMIQDLSKAADL